MLKRLFDRIPTYFLAQEVRKGDRLHVYGRTVTVTDVKWHWPHVVITTDAGQIRELPTTKLRLAR